MSAREGSVARIEAALQQRWQDAVWDIRQRANSAGVFLAEQEMPDFRERAEQMLDDGMVVSGEIYAMGQIMRTV